MTAKSDEEEQAPHLFGTPLHRCPDCGATGLRPEPDGASVRFMCEQCGSGWRVELGAVWRIRAG